MQFEHLNTLFSTENIEMYCVVVVCVYAFENEKGCCHFAAYAGKLVCDYVMLL